MPRTLPPLALIALVVAAGAGGVAAAVPADGGHGVSAAEIDTVTNTTNYLSPATDPQRTAFVRGDVDVASAVAIGAERLRGRHDRLVLDARLGADGVSETDRVRAVEQALTETERRLDRLDRRQARLFRSFANGSISGEAFVGRMARLNARAAESRAQLSHVRSNTGRDVQTSLPSYVETRLAGLRAELVALQGPIDTALSGAIRGTDDPAVIYAEGVSDGVVLATVDDGSFVRQATLRSEYAPEEPNRFAGQSGQAITLAFQRAAELYPWVFENTLGNQRISGFGDSGVYLIDASHPHGQLRSYIHGGTTNVFREEHRQQPGAVPLELSLTNASERLEVRIDAATETGPMRVVVTDGDGLPVDATVAVDGARVGTTGADGRLWTVRPSGQFRVNATTADGAVGVEYP